MSSEMRVTDAMVERACVAWMGNKIDDWTDLSTQTQQDIRDGMRQAVAAALLARTEAGADGAAMLVRDVCEMAPADPEAPDTVCIRVSDLTRIAEQYTHPQDASGDAVAELIAAADVLNTGAKHGLSTYPEDWKRLDAALDAMQAKEAK